jgi:hypothetical protein
MNRRAANPVERTRSKLTPMKSRKANESAARHARFSNNER